MDPIGGNLIGGNSIGVSNTQSILDAGPVVAGHQVFSASIKQHHRHVSTVCALFWEKSPGDDIPLGTRRGGAILSTQAFYVQGRGLNPSR